MSELDGVREMMRQRFMWWMWTAFALIFVSYLLQFTDLPLIRRSVSIVGLLCMVAALTSIFRWARRVGRF